MESKLLPLPSSPQKTDKEVKAPPSTIVNVPQDTLESMKDEIRGLEDEFDGLANRAADDIEQSIKGGETKLARVKSTITRLPVAITHHHVKFLAGKLSAINKAESVNELFSLLDLYWDFINCGLLERLIGRFGSTQRLDIYLKRLKDFRVTTTVREFTGKLACKIPSNLSEFKMVMGEQWLDNSLEAVEEFKTEFSHLCSVDKDALPFTGSSHNSVILCYALQRSFPKNAKIILPARQFLQDRARCFESVLQGSLSP